MMSARLLCNMVEAWVLEQHGSDAVEAWLHPEPVDELAERRMAAIAIGGDVRA